MLAAFTALSAITATATVNYTQTVVSSGSDDLRVRLGFGTNSIGDYDASVSGAIVSHNASLLVGTPYTLTFDAFLDGNANGGSDTIETVNHQFFASLEPDPSE